MTYFKVDISSSELENLIDLVHLQILTCKLRNDSDGEDYWRGVRESLDNADYWDSVAENDE